jgi:hypothetical protein
MTVLRGVCSPLAGVELKPHRDALSPKLRGEGFRSKVTAWCT